MSDITYKIADGLELVCNEEWADKIWDAIKPNPPNKSLGAFETPKTFFRKLYENLEYE